MTIQSVTNRQAPVAAARLNNTEAMKASMLSFEEHLARPASIDAAPVLDRPIIGASKRVRHFAAIPDTRAAAADPVSPNVAASSKLTTASTLSPDTPQAKPFYVANPYYDPIDSNSPAMIRDLTATATPQAVQWTSLHGLTTTGVMNPFGLTQNNPSIGFYGAPPTTTRT